MDEKFTYHMYVNGECTFEEFQSSLVLIKPELKKKYIQGKGYWNERHFEIVFANEHIAVGICIYSRIGVLKSAQYSLFNAKTGFCYQDTREEYRLMEESFLSY